MSDKVLLTGISGWIAKHTAIELLNSGYEVLGTVRNESLIEQTKDTISKYASIDKLSFIKLDLVKDDEIFVTSGNLGLISMKQRQQEIKSLGIKGEIGRKQIF